jgi:DNA-binding transcriptional regulator GbsR (MarR family)
MNIIQRNPYRIVGLLVGATAAEQRRQLTRLQRFLEADQVPEDDFSFPTLGQIYRTLESVNEASSKLNLNSDKMNAALFWFYKGNPITDEPAFDAIKEADLDLVLNIWTKLTSNGEVSQRNASAYSNLGTLYLSGILEGTNTNEAILEQGISLKLKFLESDFIKDFKSLATDETFKTTKKELQLLFLNQVLSEIEKSGTVTSNKFLDILTKQEFSAKEDFLKGFVQKPIEQIEKKIEESRSKRNANKANSIKAANSLLADTKDTIKQLKSILGETNIKYASIADKLAMEFFACGRDYFMHFKDTDTDPSDSSMKLFKNAKSYAIGNIAKQTIDENINNLQEWIDDKPERDKQAKIIGDFESLKNLIDEYEEKSETISNARQLLASARPYLNNVKGVLGSTDELYLGLSSRIASDAQGMCVSEINKLQERFSNTYDNATKLAAILLLKQRVDEAWEVTTTIGGMDLRQDFRTRYTQNRTSLSNLKTQLAAVNTGGRTGGSGSGGGSGCYIATMAYGDYDHPQVMILRQFRDEVLDKSALGKWFIKTYYHYSPRLVERLKNQRTVNIIIRKALNQFIKLIK